MALGVDAFEISAGRGVLATTAFPVEVSLTASFLTSWDLASPEAVTAVLFSAGFTAVLFCPWGLASDLAI